MTACTTLENRRDMYSPQTVEGPYTRMLQEGFPKKTRVEATTVETTTTVRTTDGKTIVR